MAVKIMYGAEELETIKNEQSATLKCQGKYMTKEVSVNVMLDLQTKQITPSTSPQTVEPTDGAEGLASVTVAAIQTEAPTLTPERETKTFTPTAGKYFSQVTVQGTGRVDYEGEISVNGLLVTITVEDEHGTEYVFRAQKGQDWFQFINSSANFFNYDSGQAQFRLGGSQDDEIYFNTDTGSSNGTDYKITSVGPETNINDDINISLTTSDYSDENPYQ